jgi:hypothetical protein
MPKLKRYVEDSSKSGFYVLANVGGNHPVTLQTDNIGELILKKGGYGAEDNISTEVVWSMYDVGLLYTSNTVNKIPKTQERTDEIFRDLGVANKLSDRERKKLLQELKQYQGPNPDQIKSLREDLKTSDSEGSKSDKQSQNEGEIDSIARLITLRENGKITEEEYKLLKSQADAGGDPSEPELTEKVDQSGRVEAEDDHRKLALIGAQYYETNEEFDDGLFCSFIASSKDYTMKFWGKRLSGLDQSGFSHGARSKSNELKQINKRGLLNTPWSVKEGGSWSTYIPGGGKIKTLAFIPCPPGTRFSEFTYEYKSNTELEESAEDLEAAGFDPYSTQRLVLDIDDWDSIIYQGLSDEVESALATLGYRTVN